MSELEDHGSSRRQVRASRWCISSYYAAMLSVVTLFIPGFGMVSVLAAPVAVVSGGAGLLWLAQMKSSTVPARPMSPHQRVAFKMAKRARRRATVGLAVGSAVTLFYVVVTFN